MTGVQTCALPIFVPLGADGLDRIEAVTRLWRALNKRSVPPDGRLTAQQRRRLRYMLQAVDGHMNGASYREIAAAIYGASRVGAAAWKTSALRDSTIDLVKDGAALIAGDADPAVDTARTLAVLRTVESIRASAAHRPK